MKLEGTHELDASRERVYQCLVDPEVLQRCIPGCEKLEKTAENTFAATIRAGVGSIKGVFNGTARLEDMRQPEHLQKLAALCAAGQIRPPALETLPLGEIAEAHRRIEGGHVRGKIVLEVDDTL